MHFKIKILFIFMFVFMLIPRSNAQVRVIDNKGNINEIDSSKWWLSGGNIYNKNNQNVIIGEPRTYVPNARFTITSASMLSAFKLKYPFTGALTDSILTWNSNDSIVRKISVNKLISETSHTLLSSVNTITSIVNGKSATAPAVNTVSNSLSDTNFTLTVNGVSSAPLDLKSIGTLTATPGGIVGLDSNGKINLSQLPDIAILHTFSVANDAALTSVLNAVIGDMVVTQDVGASYVLAGSDPSIFSNWIKIGIPGSTFNGRSGQVIPTIDDYMTYLIKDASAYPNLGTFADATQADINSAINTQLNLKAQLVSPALAGMPTAPTPVSTENSTVIATTAFVKNEVAASVTATTNLLTAINGNLVSTVNNVVSTPAVAVIISADNGLTTTNGKVQLGGVLSKPTTITTSTANAFMIAGLGNMGVATTSPTFISPANTGATIPTLGVDGTINATNYTTPVQPTFTGANVTWDMSKGSTAKWALATGANILNVSNMKPGMYGSIICTNTGTSTLTFGSGSNKVVNGGGSPLLTPLAGAVDILSYLYDGTIFWWTVGNNYN